MSKYSFGITASTRRQLILAALCVILPISAVANAAPPLDVATGLNGATGLALDEANDHLYFVEYNTGDLKRIVLTPGCGPACTVQTVAAGFTHPLDVALDLDAGEAYVTTEDDVGTSGAFWRVAIATGVKSLITFNLGAPHQIVLDIPAGSAYVVGRDLGKLWRVDLATGVKVAVRSGLSQPVGLAVRSDRTAAFVTEQATGNLTEIDIQVGSLVGTVVGGLSTPAYLDWTDPAELALLVSEAGANQVQSVDLITATGAAAISALPLPPSSTVLHYPQGLAYLALGSKVVSVDLVDLDLGEPVFLAVGEIPSTDICDGYANTDPGYIPHVVDAPFGKTLNIRGNLSHFKSLGATHYKVLISDGVGSPTPLALSWTAKRWNPSTNKYEGVPVAPVSGTIYEIPAEYPAAAWRWMPNFLMLQWPSTSVADGLYTFSAEIGTYDLATDTWTDLTHLLPAAVVCVPSTIPPTGNGMTLMVDNTRPTVDLKNIRLHVPGTIIPPCMIVEPFHGCNGYDFQITASDSNKHMRGLRLRALWGHNDSATIYQEFYSPPTSEGPYWWSGVTNKWVPTADPDGWQATADCAHTFMLWGWKRTTNGYHHVYWKRSHQSVTIKNTSAACP